MKRNLSIDRGIIDMILQAHKGVSTENPENTMPAFVAAAEQKYAIIELDISITRDRKFVVLHDSTINRTERLEGGLPLAEKVSISDIDYEEALKYDFGIWFSNKFAGTKIPLLEEVLMFARENKIKLKIDNKYQSFGSKEKDMFFELLKPYSDIVSLTCSSIEEIKTANKAFPEMCFHYDGKISEETLLKLNTLLTKSRLTVWIPYENAATSWAKVEYANEKLAELIKKYASLGIWILGKESELERAKILGADIVETNGQLKPVLNPGLMADMHTHTMFSHDSECDPRDMMLSQIEKGTQIFALTDHFDTNSYKEYDVFTPIKESFEKAEELNASCGDKCLVLSGVEIGEGFWHPEIYEKIISLVPYDVVIGSVHLVKYKDLTRAYSIIDFSKLDTQTVKEYFDAYLDDLLTMLREEDFDILAHLTCPLRYISGKYKASINMSDYEAKIEGILKEIIKKGIALEVNLSSVDLINAPLPSYDIIKKYYEMGGYLITLASDAHKSENASAHFIETIKMLRSIGFKNIFYYKQRKAYQITI